MEKHCDLNMSDFLMFQMFTSVHCKAWSRTAGQLQPGEGDEEGDEQGSVIIQSP